ncbi:MAG: hypothetical protein KAU24_04060 [Candidatus Aenigmarchaeota archaeon]|nr:hypothetical protein [Candidatus Aenigmarchaeota archaeon]
MGNIRDIGALVSVAEAIEKTNRGGAFFRYETAERELRKHYFLLTRSSIEDDDSEVAQVFRPLLERIKAGYKRLMATEEAARI